LNERGPEEVEVADEVAFGSTEWLDTYVKLFNENPIVKEALKDLTAKVAYEFTDRPDIPPKYVALKEGVIEEHGEMTDPGAMDYIIRANYDVWKSMTLGELDPMNALMSGKIKVTGNMAAMLKHAEGFKQTFDVVQAIPTVFD
jgi:putative sterol carrier protein